MLRILHISSYVVLAVSVIAGAFITLNNKSTQSDVQSLLDSPLTAERYKGSLPASGGKDGSKSPLLVQADALGLRLNPPAPKTPPAPRTQPGAAAAAPTVRPSAPVVAKFDLLGICVNEGDPSLSMIYINIAGEGRKWVYQGETVGRLKIEQVKDSSVIYSDGATKNELTIAQQVSEIKSLLKSDHPEVAELPAASPVTVPAFDMPGGAPALRQPGATQPVTRLPIARPTPPTKPTRDPEKEREKMEAALNMMKQWKTDKPETGKAMTETMENLEKMITPKDEK